MGFTLLGGVFIYQVSRSTVEEKRALLDKTVSRARTNTEGYLRYLTLLNIDTTDNYMSALHQLAFDSDGFIFVGDGDGKLIYVATADGCYTQNRGELPQAAVEDLMADGIYTTFGSNFYGWLSGPCFIQGTQASVSGKPDALIFVAIPPNNVLYHDLSRTFIIITSIVLVVVLIVSTVVVRGLTRPLSEMARVARSFARGDFSARVKLPQRRDEFHDMTVSFNSMAESMENVENNRRGLIASVSHDLRTPMTTIGGFVDGMLDGTIKPENQERYLRIISDEIKRLSRLASSMVEVSRLESGERELVKTHFDMSEVVRRVLIGFEQRVNEKGIELRLDMPDTLIINADHDSIFQAVYNLMDNAVKFTEQGGEITVFCELRSGWLNFYLINTGDCISPDDLKSIFNRFFKGDRSRATSAEGSGLGLYIVKTVVNRHGGDVGVKSENGKTEFRFSIPSGL